MDGGGRKEGREREVKGKGIGKREKDGIVFIHSIIHSVTLLSLL